MSLNKSSMSSEYLLQPFHADLSLMLNVLIANEVYPQPRDIHSSNHMQRSW